MTQAELGRTLGISQNSISRYERGEKVPNARNMRRLADYFGVSPAWMSGRSDDMNGKEEDSEEKEPEPADDGWLKEMVNEEAHTSSTALPQVLKKLRTDAGVSLAEVARVTGVHRQSLNTYENGTMYPGFCSLVRLASYYGVTLDYLAGREDW